MSTTRSRPARRPAAAPTSGSSRATAHGVARAPTAGARVAKARADVVEGRRRRALGDGAPSAGVVATLVAGDAGAWRRFVPRLRVANGDVISETVSFYDEDFYVTRYARNSLRYVTLRRWGRVTRRNTQPGAESRDDCDQNKPYNCTLLGV